jgi:Uma2 family endonuclease
MLGFRLLKKTINGGVVWVAKACSAKLAQVSAIIVIGSMLQYSGRRLAGVCTARAFMNVTVAETELSERMSGPAFRSFQSRRPDHEQWELIGGVPTMMTPPTITHSRIAGNIERLLNDALAEHDPSRLATQRLGIDLGSGDYKPEPDVGVIDADYQSGQRFVERAYLLAEVVSSTDNLQVPGTTERWIDVKRQLYLDHPFCEAVLIIEQDRLEVRADVRTESGWRSHRLVIPEAELELPTFGLRCSLSNLYEGTPLRPRGARRNRI